MQTFHENIGLNNPHRIKREQQHRNIQRARRLKRGEARRINEMEGFGFNLVNREVENEPPQIFNTSLTILTCWDFLLKGSHSTQELSHIHWEEPLVKNSGDVFIPVRY